MARKRTPNTIAFGRVVREARVERDFVQEAFARHAGIDRSYVGAIERGEFNVSLETMVKLAVGLDVRPSELLRGAQL
jgi:transcriptional regulator with XRE-family HTH domain